MADILLYNGIERKIRKTSEKSKYFKVRDLNSMKVLFKSKSEEEVLKKIHIFKRKGYLLSIE